MIKRRNHDFAVQPIKLPKDYLVKSGSKNGGAPAIVTLGEQTASRGKVAFGGLDSPFTLSDNELDDVEYANLFDQININKGAKTGNK